MSFNVRASPASDATCSLRDSCRRRGVQATSPKNESPNRLSVPDRPLRSSRRSPSLRIVVSSQMSVTCRGGRRCLGASRPTSSSAQCVLVRTRVVIDFMLLRARTWIKRATAGLFCLRAHYSSKGGCRGFRPRRLGGLAARWGRVSRGGVQSVGSVGRIARCGVTPSTGEAMCGSGWGGEGGARVVAAASAFSPLLARSVSQGTIENRSQSLFLAADAAEEGAPEETPRFLATLLLPVLLLIVPSAAQGIRASESCDFLEK
mmetsp:Transcript_6361/g.8754  ORF Transcript_6361/g.8754 Transcript_6361/m.8754 type:complete len:261 (+) Transcript_6361:327-1109(+)